MGTTSKTCLVILRVWELICSVIVLGIVAHFVRLVATHSGLGPQDSRLIYTLVLASVSTVYAIIFMPPLMHSFFTFPADFALFVMWICRLRVAHLCELSKPFGTEVSILTDLICRESAPRPATLTGTTATGAPSGGTPSPGPSGPGARSGERRWPFPSWLPSAIRSVRSW